MRLSLAASVMCLAGCASPQVVSSTPRNVIVHMPIAGSYKFAAGDAAALGEAECVKYHRHARMTDRPDGVSRDWVFDCVE
jgi:hypothetical protein